MQIGSDLFCAIGFIDKNIAVLQVWKQLQQRNRLRAIVNISGRQQKKPQAAGLFRQWHEFSCSDLRVFCRCCLMSDFCSLSYSTTCLHGCFDRRWIHAQLRASARGRAELEDLFQGSIIPPTAEAAVHSLMRTESRRKIAPARTTAGKPQDAIEMRANILLRATGMRDRDKWPDQFPFLIGKFITTGFHACHFFLPLSYHLFVSFLCPFRYF